MAKKKQEKPLSKEELDLVCTELTELQRQRAALIRWRVMLTNKLRAHVAYYIAKENNKNMGDEESDQKFYKLADEKISSILEGKEVLLPYTSMVQVMHHSVDPIQEQQNKIEKEMLIRAKKLPVAAWLELPEQRGFGLLSLATLVGCTGNLSNYSRPRKVCRRMACEPWEFGGNTWMGSTWKIRSKSNPLPAEEWVKYGYSPDKRCISYLFGENLMRGNKSIYRKKYEESKLDFRTRHPDATDQNCHRHGMLLACKLLLKNIWREWNKDTLVETVG